MQAAPVASCAGGGESEIDRQTIAPAASLLPDAGADQALLLLEVEWQQRMEAPLRSLADFEAQLMDAIDRVEDSLLPMVGDIMEGRGLTAPT
jgi:hypothetical protein